METLANLGSFVQAAQEGNFSAAGRRLGLTPAVVSRNVATLEGNLGIQLFHRSTRKLTLTGPGTDFFASIHGHLANLQAAIADAAGGGAVRNARPGAGPPTLTGKPLSLPQRAGRPGSALSPGSQAVRSASGPNASRTRAYFRGPSGYEDVCAFRQQALDGCKTEAVGFPGDNKRFAG